MGYELNLSCKIVLHESTSVDVDLSTEARCCLYNTKRYCDIWAIAEIFGINNFAVKHVWWCDKVFDFLGYAVH